MAKMSMPDLKALLGSERAAALSAMQTGKLSVERERAMNYYLGNMTQDMPSEDGRSSAVSSDVADTVEGLMPGLMDIFCSSDEVVKFNAVGENDEEAAQQESDYVNHVFMQKNPGFIVLHDFIKDCLLQKLGIVKVYWDESEEEARETYLNLMDDQFAKIAYDVLQPDSGLEIVEHDEEEKPGAPDPMTGQPTVVKSHNVTLLRTKKYAQTKIVGVPPEEFGMERDARMLNNEFCNYCFHKIPNLTEGKLLAQGYDEDQVKALPSYSFATNTEELARDTVEEEFFAGDDGNRTTRPIEIYEHYVRMDYKGDGKPCLYRVTAAGNDEVLMKGGKPDVEPFDEFPFATMTPIRQPHRVIGRSVADLVMDIQRINTALLRGLLDNSYMVANPRTEVAESGTGPNTLDDLLTVRPNGLVRVKVPGTLNQLQTPSIAAALLPVMTYIDSVREMRSGVTRQGQGIDADALQNQSATAVNQVFSVAQAKMKLIARILAETGIKDMFWLIHAITRKHGQEAETVKLRNKWVSVDPRNWVSRDSLTVDVGLGAGGKAEQFSQTMAIANVQEKLVAGGKTNIVDDAKLYSTAAQLTKLVGHKNPDAFFNNPAEKNPDGSLKYPPPPPPMDPKLMAVQAKAQHDQQALQGKTQLESVQAQADIAVQDRKTQAEMAQSQMDFQLKERLALLEAQLKERADQRAHEAHLLDMQHKRELHDHSLKQGVLGMVATAHAHDAKMAAMKAKPETSNA